MSEVKLYANPYAGGKGFYFSSVEDYEKKYKAAFKRTHVEEYEIEFIEGDDEDQQLFEAMKPDQGSFPKYLEVVDEFDTDRKAALYGLLRNGYDLDKAIDESDSGVFRGTAVEYAEELISDMGGPTKEMSEMYFDYEAFARDMDYNGDIDEFEFAGQTYVSRK